MGRLGLKGCDIMYDVYRLQRKREQLSDKDSEFENSDITRLKKQMRKTKHVEEDYIKYLMLLYNYDNSQPYTDERGNESSAVVRYSPNEDEDDYDYDYDYDYDDDDDDDDDDEDEDEDEDEDDPEYKKFLANVKSNGRSYVLKIDRKDGFPMFVEYEKEDVSDEEYERLGRRKQHDTGDEKDLGNVSSKDNVESQPFSRTFLENDDDRSAVDNDPIFEPFDPVSQKKKGLSSQKLNMGENGAFKRCRKGETKNKSNKERKTEKGRKSANITTNDEAADVDEDYALLLEKFMRKKWPLKVPYIRKWVRKQPLSRTVKKKKKKLLTSENRRMKENDGSKRQGKGEKKKRSSKEQTTRKRKKSANVTAEEEVVGRNSANVTVKEEVVDVDEASFKGGNCIEYKAAEEDLQILDNDNGTFGKEGSAIIIEASTAKHFESVEDSFPTKTMHSDFWWKLRALLERPYDQKEYRGLWKAVKRRKHTLRNMDLRNGVKFYSTRHMGKSYLDHYRDLHEKLKEVDGDNRKQLIILRGFFFWLQNLTQQGAFQPWTDPEWLSLLAQSS